MTEPRPEDLPTLRAGDRTNARIDPPTEETLSPASPVVPPGGEGEPFGRYLLVEKLGQGGMGVVWKALDTQLRRVVALKMLLGGDGDPATAERFLREARASARLKHPNIVGVYDVGVVDGRHFFTSDCIEGLPLDQALATGRPSVRRVLEAVKEVAEALAYAHDQGIVHRDVKPQNILIDRDGRAHVMDFGLAKDVREALGRGLTIEGQLLGTPAYMSPEQAACSADAIGPASDQFSLGVVLYEQLTGAKPFVADSLAGILDAVREAEPIRPTLVSSRVHRDVETLCLKALEKDPSQRYPSMKDFAADIGRWLAGEPIAARPVGRAGRLLRRMRRNPVVSALSVSLVATVLTVLAIAWRDASREREARQQEATASAVREEEARVAAFFTLVSKRSHRIDSHFLTFQESLEGLASAAVQALTRGTPSSEALYLAQDFDVPARQPPDLAPSSHYAMAVSLDWPLWVLAPGVARASVEEEMRRLGPLRLRCRKMFLERREKETPAPSGAEAERRLLLERGVPLAWCYVGLKEGVLFLYPGHGHVQEGYDPRVRPWYTLSAGKEGKRWGNPYVDTTDRRIYLPCTTSLYSDAGEFLGVAGVEMSFDYVIDSLLSLPDAPAVLRESLVDADGRVMVDTSDRDRRVMSARFDAGVPRDPYSVAEVREKVHRRVTGGVDVERDGRQLLEACFRLEDLGWYYVVEADLARVRSGK